MARRSPIISPPTRLPRPRAPRREGPDLPLAPRRRCPAAAIRQQFSTPVNIAISLYGIDFLRRAGDLLAVDGERPDIGLREGGYLFLATEAGAATLARNHALQTGLGADIVHLDAAALAARFPVARDRRHRRRLLRANRRGLVRRLRADAGAPPQGARPRRRADDGRGRGDRADGDRATGVRLADGTRIAAGTVVVTAGTATPALLAPLGVALPVEARKRYGLHLRLPRAAPRLSAARSTRAASMSAPRATSTSAAPRRRRSDDPPATDFEVDHAFFEETIWPVLAARVPAFEAIRPGRAWAGHYDFNTLRPQRDRRAAARPSPTCSSPPASPATACSRRRRSAAASPSWSSTAVTRPSTCRRSATSASPKAGRCSRRTWSRPRRFCRRSVAQTTQGSLERFQ